MRRRLLCGFGAVASGVAAIAVASVLVDTVWGIGIEREVASGVANLYGGGWRLLRGGLGQVVRPVLVIALPVALVVLLRRRGMRAALFGALVILGANATVQAVKAGRLAFPPSARPSAEPLLSGHVPLVASAAVVAVLLAPARVRRPVAVVAALGTAATTVGVVVTGWHTVGEAVAPLFIVLAWTLAAGAVAGSPEPVRSPMTSVGFDRP